MTRLSDITHGSLDDLDYYLENHDLDNMEMRAAIQRVLREVRRVDAAKAELANAEGVAA